MKFVKYLFIALGMLAISCSKDKDPEPAQETASLSLASNQQVITPPAGLQKSNDPMAQVAAAWIGSANIMSTYFTYFNAPTGATKSTTAITASNGRTSAGSSVTVYTWKDAQSGYSIAYQTSITADAYSFDIFLTLPGDTKWLKYIHAEELKDKSKGSMKVYDILGLTDRGPSFVFFTYDWSRAGDVFTLKMNDFTESARVELSVNEKTKAGSVKVYTDNIIEFDMSWTATGDGTWKSYDETGKLDSSGSWVHG